VQNNEAKPEITRIHLPSRTPAIPPRDSSIPSPVVSAGPPVDSPIIPLRRPPALPAQAAALPVPQPQRKPPGAPPTPSESAPSGRPNNPIAPPGSESFARVSAPADPKKEMARIILLPARSPTAALVQPTSTTVATSNAIDAFDSIPRWLCWGLLGISAFIFLTQIWNYALS
jgi:hypothetical protein